ncbi:MAG: RDD family protein [Elusimicrobiota bacterium]|nr:MAG: RDD family protein [Elusimicrobiota bacterium]
MEQAPIEVRAARFSDRFVAYLLDGFPFGAGAIATVWVLLIRLEKAPTADLLATVAAAWITALFGYQLLGNMAGGTLGKRLLGLRVVLRDGGGTPASAGRSRARSSG